MTVFSPFCIIDVQDIDDDPVDPPLQSPVASSSSVDCKDTQRKVLMQLQSIFAHLIEGRLQFHTPQGFWRDFRLSGTCSVLVVYMHVVDQLTCMRYCVALSILPLPYYLLFLTLPFSCLLFFSILSFILPSPSFLPPLHFILHTFTCACTCVYLSSIVSLYLFLGIYNVHVHIVYTTISIPIPRLWGERVNLREQHDAFEFFNCLVDSLDEGLKSFSYNPVLSEVLGGAFADQKICKGCPHRLGRPQCITQFLHALGNL